MPARLIGMCSTGELPESTTMLRVAPSKSECVTLISYSPIGTASNSNSPSELVCAARDQSDVLDWSLTVASAIGRCWGSWTIPRILPRIVARADCVYTSSAAASRSHANFRIRVLHSKSNSLQQWNEARLEGVQTERGGIPKQ